MTGQPVDSERLHRLLGGDDLDWFRRRLREAFERGSSPASVALRDPTAAERQRMADLLGRRLPVGSSLTVRLADVEAVLRHSGAAPDLRGALERLDGPLRDRRAERAAADHRWARALAPLDELLAIRPGLEPWRDRLRGGLLRRLAADVDDAASLVVSACRVLELLPAVDLPRGVLARSATGDAHALDDDRALATLVLLALATQTGTEPADDAESRRALWLAGGVLTGKVTMPVLTLGLPGDTTTPTGRALGAWREAGQPVHLSLRQLEHDPPGWPLSGHTVFVCENPVVVAAAADLAGASCRPLLCLGGQPAGAARLLLRQLVTAGALLAVHGDFDWGGTTIVGGVLRRLGGSPWRYDTASYRAALPAAAQGGALAGRPTDTPWDPPLRAAMLAAGVRIEEEAVLDELLSDLG